MLTEIEILYFRCEKALGQSIYYIDPDSNKHRIISFGWATALTEEGLWLYLVDCKYEDFIVV